MNADVRLDPAQEDLPSGQILELRMGRVLCKSTMDQRSDRDVEAAMIAAGQAIPSPKEDRTSHSSNITVADALTNGPSLRARVQEDVDLMHTVRAGYAEDNTFCKILESPTQFTTFMVREGLVYTRNRQFEEVLCIPRVMFK